MPASTGPNYSIKYGWNLGEFYKTEMDANLKRLDALSHLSVLSMTLISPPGSPVAGDRYVVGPLSSGTWTGHDGKIAVYIGAAWEFYAPSNGWLADNRVDGLLYRYADGAWSAITGGRSQLAANRTYYVRTDGSDSNTGLANTAGAAFLTVQKAIDVICGTLDISIYTVTIQIADGTYTGQCALKSFVGAGSVVLNGNPVNPENVIISTTSMAAIIATNCRGSYAVNNLKVQTTTSGVGIGCVGAPSYITFNNIVFGACATAHLYAADGGYLLASGNYSITGGSAVHYQCVRGAQLLVPARTVTLTGTPAFSAAFAYAYSSGSILAYSITFSGAATGPRYNVGANAVIDTQGGGSGYFPGNAGGAAATGGQYL